MVERIRTGRAALLRALLAGGSRAERGQASVETVALIPIFVLVAMAMGQAALAGYAAWTAAGAARIGARAEALGAEAGPAVRGELPSFLRSHASVRVADPAGEHPGRVLVTLRVPRVVPGLELGSVRGRAVLPSQAGA